MLKKKNLDHFLLDHLLCTPCSNSEEYDFEQILKLYLEPQEQWSSSGNHEYRDSEKGAGLLVKPMGVDTIIGTGWKIKTGSNQYPYLYLGGQEIGWFSLIFHSDKNLHKDPIIRELIIVWCHNHTWLYIIADILAIATLVQH